MDELLQSYFQVEDCKYVRRNQLDELWRQKFNPNRKTEAQRFEINDVLKKRAWKRLASENNCRNDR